MRHDTRLILSMTAIVCVAGCIDRGGHARVVANEDGEYEVSDSALADERDSQTVLARMQSTAMSYCLERGKGVRIHGTSSSGPQDPEASVRFVCEGVAVHPPTEADLEAAALAERAREKKAREDAIEAKRQRARYTDPEFLRRREALAAKAAKRYRVTIGFISQGSGPDQEMSGRLARVVREQERRLGRPLDVLNTTTGPEGEGFYCYPLTELSRSKQREFVAALRKELTRTDMLQIKENTRCDINLNFYPPEHFGL